MMRVWFWTRVKKSGHLNGFFRDVFQITDNILRLSEVRSTYNLRHMQQCLLFICARHVPGPIYHLLTLRQELIQVPYTLRILVE